MFGCARENRGGCSAAGEGASGSLRYFYEIFVELQVEIVRPAGANVIPAGE